MGIRLLRSSDKPHVSTARTIARAHELIERARAARYEATGTCARSHQMVPLHRVRNWRRLEEKD
jgi:hypothetical protein